MKKVLILSLCFVLIIGATIGTTIAATRYSDGSKISIGLGSVRVRLVEEQRSDHGFEPHVPPTVFFPDPSAYTDSPALKPTVPVSWHDGSELLFWENLPRAMDKIVSVQNTSKKDAYIRIVFAFEDTNHISDHLYLNVVDPEALAYACRTEINGTPYQLYTYSYDELLPAGEHSAPSLLEFVFDTSVDQTELSQIGGTYDILVYAEAVQAEGFDDADAAYNAAFGKITEKNHPWA